ncbi:hypothetical protein [Arthrobacter methylotrophus]|uniref:Uncharacterized protein n=1 Tax=Arthrobacter methylotrophus TaxID=121291 RepID=A0ABV5UTK7_9MICC
MHRAAEDLAVAGGWAVVSETETGEFLGRLGEAMRRLTNELGDGPTGRRVTGGVGGRVLGGDAGVRTSGWSSKRAVDDFRPGPWFPAGYGRRSQAVIDHQYWQAYGDAAGCRR